MKPEQLPAQLLGEAVLEAAEELFLIAGCPEDFCIQHISGDTAIFGGFNRVIWTPMKGFRLDPSYCTVGFVNAVGPRLKRGE